MRKLLRAETQIISKNASSVRPAPSFEETGYSANYECYLMWL